jgi:DNA-binding NarL/FixJ family response regulator
LCGRVAASVAYLIDESPTEERPGALARRGTVGTSWVLLVEGRTPFRQCLGLLLEWRTGLECVPGGSPAEARRILDGAQEAPVVAIVDLDLPEAGAFELLERLRRRPVLALTASKSLETRARALEAGADTVLSTASPVEVIVAAVQRFVA